MPRIPRPRAVRALHNNNRNEMNQNGIKIIKLRSENRTESKRTDSKSKSTTALAALRASHKIRNHP